MKHMIFRISAKYHCELLCTYGHGRWLREDVIYSHLLGVLFFAYPCIEILKHWFVKIFFNQIKLVDLKPKNCIRVVCCPSLLLLSVCSIINILYWVIQWFWRFIYNLSVSYMVLLFKSVYGFGGKVRLYSLNFLFVRACCFLSVCGVIQLCFVKGEN